MPGSEDPAYEPAPTAVYDDGMRRVIVATAIVSVIAPVSHPVVAQPAAPIVTGPRAAAAFAVAGTPVHPLCLSALDSYRKTPKDVSNCSDPAIRVATKSDGSREADIAGPPMEWYSYRVLARKGDRFFIFTDLAPGGTGKFTSLSWVRLADNKVNTVSDVRGGDRCAGGISAPTFSALTVTYQVNLTTAALVALASPGLDTNVAKKLSDAYPDCAGYAEYRYDLSRETEQLTSVTLNPPEAPRTIGGTVDPQSCVEDLVRQQITTSRKTLSPVQLQDFGRRFTATCARATQGDRR
jgi:hypothetical protein